MTNLLKLFNEVSSHTWEGRLEGELIVTDLKSIMRTFKKIKTELELQNPPNQFLINRVNEGIANTESLLRSMGASYELEEPLQDGNVVNRP